MGISGMRDRSSVAVVIERVESWASTDKLSVEDQKPGCCGDRLVQPNSFPNLPRFGNTVHNFACDYDYKCHSGFDAIHSSPTPPRFIVVRIDA